jgi:hypothetical protein
VRVAWPIIGRRGVGNANFTPWYGGAQNFWGRTLHVDFWAAQTLHGRLWAAQTLHLGFRACSLRGWDIKGGGSFVAVHVPPFEFPSARATRSAIARAHAQAACKAVGTGLT